MAHPGAALLGVPLLLAVLNTAGAAQSITPGDPDDRPFYAIELLEGLPGIRAERATAVTDALGVHLLGQSAKYTRVMMDGLPLFGPAFGGPALAGLTGLEVNGVGHGDATATAPFGSLEITSRQPDGMRQIVLAQSSLDRTDAEAWLSGRMGARGGWSLTAGAQRQSRRDLDGDGWQEVPGLTLVQIRPRLVRRMAGGASLLATAGFSAASITGGTSPGTLLRDSTTFQTDDRSTRADGGLIAVIPAMGGNSLTLRAAALTQWRREDFGPPGPYRTQHGHHTAALVAATLGAPRPGFAWRLETGWELDAHRASDLNDFDYTYSVPYALAEAIVARGTRFSVATTARCDRHSRFGTICSPGGAAQFAPGAWRLRLTAGAGYHAPTPFIDESEGVAFARLVPFNSTTIVTCNPALCGSTAGPVKTTAPFSLREERIRYATAAAGWHTPMRAVTAAVFGSVIDHRLILWEFNIFQERPQYINAPEPQRSTGVLLDVIQRLGPVTISLDYQFIHSTMSRGDGQRAQAPLTPTHSGTVEGNWRSAGGGTRVEVALRYTGQQTTFDNPYRRLTQAFATVDAALSRHLRRVDVELRVLNAGGVRQTDYDPLIAPAPDDRRRRTTDVWAPLEGRMLGIGMRFRL